jgi:hypothetical protein
MSKTPSTPETRDRTDGVTPRGTVDDRDDRKRGHQMTESAGARIAGPALVQSAFTTVVLADGDTATAHSAGDILIDAANI